MAGKASNAGTTARPLAAGKKPQVTAEKPAILSSKPVLPPGKPRLTAAPDKLKLTSRQQKTETTGPGCRPRSKPAPEESSVTLKSQVRELLRAQKVQLWCTPHSAEDGTGTIAVSLVESLVTCLPDADACDIAIVLEGLRAIARRKMGLPVVASEPAVKPTGTGASPGDDIPMPTEITKCSPPAPAVSTALGTLSNTSPLELHYAALDFGPHSSPRQRPVSTVQYTDVLSSQSLLQRDNLTTVGELDTSGSEDERSSADANSAADIATVSAWLNSIGLPQYTEAFEGNGYEDFAFVAAELELDDLEAISISDQDHVARILQSLTALRKRQ